MRSPLAARIAQRMGQLRLSKSDLARKAGVDRRLLSRLLKGDQEGIRDERVIVRIAHGLGTTAAWLLGSVPDPDPPVHRPARRLPLPEQRRVQPPVPPRPSDAEEIAAITAEAETEDTEEIAAMSVEVEAEAEEAERWRLREAPPEAFFLHKLIRPFLEEPATKVRHGAGGRRGPIPLFGDGTQTIIRIDGVPETIERPPLLYGRAGAYGLVAGPGWEPRYEAGEILYVVPGLPLRARDWVVVVAVTTHGADDTMAEARTAQVRRLVRLMRKGAELAVPGSDKFETLPLDRLVAVHRVVLAGQRTL